MMPLPVSVYLFPYWIRLLYPFPSSFILFRCVAQSLSLSLLCLPIWVVLYCLYMYMVASLALRVIYMVALVYFAFDFLFFPPKSLPGDDVLCRLLPRPLPSVCFLARLFVLFIYFPTVFVLDLFWCNFLYLVTTAGIVADQLIM